MTFRLPNFQTMTGTELDDFERRLSAESDRAMKRYRADQRRARKTTANAPQNRKDNT
ncbi:MAG: hypothetical protein SGJ21_01080 [Alphaproteobacteria bacterium]|nr:hypothetical protein [Alphaproteobacteria bacterium]